MSLPKVIVPRLTRPVAVLGAGVSGVAVRDLLAKNGVACVIYDEKGGDGAKTVFGEAEARSHSLVVYSPGFARNHPWLVTARREDALCLGEIDFAALFWDGPVVAVTGTNGKTTITEFLSFAFKRLGKDAVAVGNVGFPFSRIHEAAANRTPIAVCEVSSFQAEDLRHFSPSALIWTNFDEDHLDRHAGLESYFRAKFKLVDRLAGRRLFVGESVVEAARKFGVELPAYTEVGTRAEVEGLVPEGVFSSRPQRENYALIRRYWLAEGLPLRALDEAARVFTPVRHRLAKIADIGAVEFWNDSKGTNFHAVLGALPGFAGGPVFWIGGGKGKGGDVHGFACKVAEHIDSGYLIGETGPEIAEALAEKGRPARVFKTLPEAVHAAHKAASAAGKPATVLFSPGFSSFDMFKSYAERGIAFEQAVFALRGNISPKSR